MRSPRSAPSLGLPRPRITGILRRMFSERTVKGTASCWPAALVLVLAGGSLFAEEQGAGSPRALTSAEIACLNSHGWDARVQSSLGVWVRADLQRLFLIQDHRVIKAYVCSTATAGLGNENGSGKTPVGWHVAHRKIGKGLDRGAILKGRRWTGKIWREGDSSKADLVLSRLIWLRGQEPGENLGGEVDTWKRYIYIHGTNHVKDLGKPASHGCVRVDPSVVIDLFDRIPKGACVLITE